MNLNETLEAALQSHQAGRLQEAETLYRRILAAIPNHANALHMLGVLAHQAGDNDIARELIAKSIALQPSAPDAYGNLGLVLQARGELDNAIKCYRQAITIAPDQAELHNRLGSALRADGKLDEAIESLQTAVRLDPNLAAAHNNLGNAYRAQNQTQEALASYRRALSLQPDHIEALNNLANSLRESGAAAEAIRLYRRALELRPGHPQVLAHLADALEDAGQLAEAIGVHRQIVAVRPDDFDVLLRLGNALMKAGAVREAIEQYVRALALRPESAAAQFDFGCALHAASQPDKAVRWFREALKIEPTFAAASNNLGSALKDLGRLDEALAAYAQALDIQPDYREADDNLIYSQLFHPSIRRERMAGELRRWSSKYAEPLADAIVPHTNDRSPQRPLRIGYVSPDFRDHVVGRNVLPVLMRHDTSRFEIFCYSNVQHPDALTERFVESAAHWRDIARISDADAAEMIRRDGIDILVDLALHLTHNRLLIFARKPAPVQMTWAGYPGTTGLKAVDYRLTDPYLDPPGLNNDELYAEKSLRLPHSFWRYDPLGIDLPVNELPADTHGFITFGGLNNFCKLNDATLSLWGDLLSAVPSSRLRLLAPEGSARQWVLDRLRDDGIYPGRVIFHRLAPRLEYLSTYHHIDIALDTFPYNGHTTSLDALWMGVPLLTVAGTSPVARAGVSQLSNVGLTELIAGSPRRFVQLGVALAGDLPRLCALRQSLRPRLEQSPIMDAARFTADLEVLYRSTWQNYCTGSRAGFIPPLDYHTAG